MILSRQKLLHAAVITAHHTATFLSILACIQKIMTHFFPDSQQVRDTVLCEKKKIQNINNRRCQRQKGFHSWNKKKKIYIKKKKVQVKENHDTNQHVRVEISRKQFDVRGGAVHSWLYAPELKWARGGATSKLIAASKAFYWLFLLIWKEEGDKECSGLTV